MNDLLLFCNIDEYGFPHWNGIDLFRWYAMPPNWHYMTGNAYLWLYKTSWLVYYREAIKKYAKEAEVPELFLLARVIIGASRETVAT
ncbi:hypothetical protein ACQ9QS_000532 [Cronobacter sakazakii]